MSALSIGRGACVFVTLYRIASIQVDLATISFRV